MKTLRELAVEAHETSVSKGWWDGVPKEQRRDKVPEKIALMHSELSEALEEYRKNPSNLGTYYSAGGKPEGFCVELADALIRIVETAEALGLSTTLADALEEKLAYNKSRPHRHGGKAC